MVVESLTAMTDAETLTAVKFSLNINGSQFDTTLTNYINEVKEYLKSAGVSYATDNDVVSSTLAIGCISRGVADLWNYGNGDTKLSEYFYQRADQLRDISVSEVPPTPPTPVYTKAKIIVNATDKDTGVAVTDITVTITGYEPEEDGYFHLEASDTEYRIRVVPTSGYYMKSVNFLVTNEDVEAGEKTVPVPLTAM